MARPKKEVINDEVEIVETPVDNIEVINEVFADLEKVLLHGTVEMMNKQQNELLSAKIKIKRLF